MYIYYSLIHKGGLTPKQHVERDSNQNSTKAELKMRAVKVTSGVSNNYYLLIKIINITK
jgi:hypothetical protein